MPQSSPLPGGFGKKIEPSGNNETSFIAKENSVGRKNRKIFFFVLLIRSCFLKLQLFSTFS
jgi:hypothetical protein